MKDKKFIPVVNDLPVSHPDQFGQRVSPLGDAAEGNGLEIKITY